MSWALSPTVQETQKTTKNHAVVVSFLSPFPQISLQPEHAGDAMEEKVAMPMYLKPREALLPISYRNQV